MTAQEQQAMDGFTRSSSFTFCLDTWIHPHFLARIPPERQVQHARMRSTMIVSIPTRPERRVQRRKICASLGIARLILCCRHDSRGHSAS